jgi:DedD protein
MGLLSIFKRRSAESGDVDPDVSADAVALARSRARRRLIGAALLLAVGVIGFPLLFETQPRPIAVDIPIEIPARDKLPPLAMTPAPGALPPATATPPQTAPVTSAAPATPATPVAPAAPADVTTRTQTPLAETAPRPGQVSQAAKPVEVPVPPAERPARLAEPVPPPTASKPAAAKSAATAPSAPAANPAAREAARAQALLEGKPAADDAAVRVVVQVGAYTDPDKLRQARSKLEVMGYKTYTQVVEVNGEKRTRVRVGPFIDRAEAEKVATRIKAAGLQAAVLAI